MGNTKPQNKHIK